MARIKEPWRSLRISDMVRIVRMPSGVDAPGYVFHRMTRQLCKRLIERKRPVRVYEVAYGAPWISCRFRRKDGRWEYHSLAINDDSWVRVKHRKKRPIAKVKPNRDPTT
jgi:hypothetical protein